MADATVVVVEPMSKEQPLMAPCDYESSSDTGAESCLPTAKVSNTKPSPEGVVILNASAVKPPAHTLPLWLRGLCLVAAGVCFGFALNKADVYRAEVIRDQFVFSQQTMLKVFLTGAATSTLVITLMYTRRDNAVIHASGTSAREASGLVAPAVGGLLLGCGMAVAGSCPGTIWAQLGSGSVASFETLGAGIVAALVYGLVFDKYLQPVLSWGVIRHKVAHDVLPKWMNRTVVGLGMAACLYLVVGLLFVAEAGPALSRPFNAAVWNPVWSGLVIGGLQVPMVWLMGTNVGCSSSFVTMAAALAAPFGTTPYLKKHRSGLRNWWQVLFVLSAALGSYVAYASGTDTVKYDVQDTVSWWQCGVGGALIVWGARIGNGCTSGHGISGMGHLAIRSMLAVGTMFVGGIATTFAFFK